MEDGCTIQVEDIFHFKDGRTVFVGEVENGPKFIKKGRFGVWLDGEWRGSIDIEGEMLNGGSKAGRAGPLRSVSTTDKFRLDRESIANRNFVLKPTAPLDGRRSLMHRHLIGLESPPPEYVADPMTLGPVLPEGWDGDAWEKVGGRGGSFLRAWNKATGRVAYATATSYEEARRLLLLEVSSGGQAATLAPPGSK
jgi:hypothetical protein